jgi:hypothetical protein
MEPVYTRVARDLEDVQTSVAELKHADDAAVTWWSAERLRTWSTRPWNQDGKQLPLVHHARVGIEVKFRDFAALSDWVGEHVTNTGGFHVTNIEWALTVKRGDELIRQVHEGAVHDAMERAQLYADARGLGKISPVAIADAGMLVANLRPNGGHGQAHTVARAGLEAGHGSGVELLPDDIEVAASVDARFVVEGSGSSSSSSPADTRERRELGLGIRRDPNADPSVGEFRDDDAGYLAWLAAHPDGYVINIARSCSATLARVHHAGCWTISGQNAAGVALTEQYVKVCAEQLADLDQWAINHVGEPIRRCGTCHPPSDAVPPSSIEQTEQAVAPPLPEGRCEIHGPAADSAVVQAWADDYIRFEHLTVWQKHLRDEIRSRCRQLERSAGQVLHATFFGDKLLNADVENLALYNIDSFRVAGGNGIRFEHGGGVPLAPDGAELSVLLPIRARAAVGYLHPLGGGANAGLVRLDRPGRVRGREEAGTSVAGAVPRRRRGVRAGCAQDAIRRQSPGPAAARASAGVGWIGEGDLRWGDLRVAGPHRHGGPAAGRGTTREIPSGTTRRDRGAPA